MPTIDDASISRLKSQLKDSQDKTRISLETSVAQLSRIKTLAESLSTELTELSEVADDPRPDSSSTLDRLENSRWRISQVQLSLQQSQQELSQVFQTVSAILKQWHDLADQIISNLR
jgi:hypothetical protein